MSAVRPAAGSWILVPVIASLAAGAMAAEPIGGLAEVVDIVRQRGLTFDEAAAARAAAEAAVQACDPLGSIFTKADYEAKLDRQAGYVTGVAIRFAITNEKVRVTEVSKDTAAAAAGIKAGDMIESIEDQETKGMHPMQVLGLLRGPVGETVHFLARREDNTVVEWDVGRDRLRAPSFELAEDLPSGLGYIRLNGLTDDNGPALVVEQLKLWSADSKFGVVLDLRGAGGANVKAAARVASLFAEPGAMLFAFRDREDQDIEVMRAETDGPGLTAPIMVLVDGETSGAAEILAAVLRGSGRGAMLIGAPTMGDPGIREAITLATGDILYLATRRMVVADGTVYSGAQGVKPDITVGLQAAPVADYEPEKELKDLSDEEKDHKRLRERVKDDAALKRAVDVLIGLKALNIRSFGKAAHTSR